MRQFIAMVFAATLVSGSLLAEEKSIDGKWVIESVVKDGKEDPTWKEAIRENNGDKYSMAKKGGKSVTGAMKVDASKKTIDLMPSEGTYKGKTLHGIFEIEGDTLKICFAEPGKDRPTKLETGAGITLATHKKAK